MKSVAYFAAVVAVIGGALAISGTDSQARKLAANGSPPIIGIGSDSIASMSSGARLEHTFLNPADATRAAGMAN